MKLRFDAYVILCTTCFVLIYCEQIDVSCSVAYDLPVDDKSYLLLKKLGMLLASLGYLLSSLWVRNDLISMHSFLLIHFV